MLDNNKNMLIDIGKVFLNTFLFLFACFLIGLIYLIFLSKDLPSLQELQKFNPEQVSKIISSDGEVLGELYFHKRDVVSLLKVLVILLKKKEKELVSLLKVLVILLKKKEKE